ncbi:hypothetical protein [Sphingomonas sp. LY160]|uniref:hypothetical protein n=1 Tax=Sphingomonas sp. LY160 TaxID=3095342 RepID=UPI002ADEA828|nr:hypothetical protein [Sphingomonas sp. LY160]MEA1072983.1 hypothetical protein [Sphingomonas sp. LY160]
MYVTPDVMPCRSGDASETIMLAVVGGPAVQSEFTAVDTNPVNGTPGVRLTPLDWPEVCDHRTANGTVGSDPLLKVNALLAPFPVAVML